MKSEGGTTRMPGYSELSTNVRQDVAVISESQCVCGEVQ